MMKLAFAQLALGVMLFTGCEHKVDSPITLKSTNGQLQMTVPVGWAAATNLNAEADIQAKNAAKNTFCIVLADSRADLAGTFDEYVQGRVDALTKSLADVKTSDKTPVKAGDGDAYQFQVEGTTTGDTKLKIVYILTLLQTKSYWIQVLAWATPSNFVANKDELTKIAATVSETQK